MKVSEFRTYIDLLSRFATTREKATGPQSYVGIQKRGAELKFISGVSTAGVVVDIPEHESETGNFTYTVNARPLLQSAKVLPAKANITIVADRGGLHIQTEGGGVFDLSKTDVSMREAGFAKRPKEFQAEGPVSVKNLKRMSKLFKAVSAKIEVPGVQVKGGTAFATVVAPGNRAQYVNYRFPASGQDGYNMAAYRSFWEALTHFQSDGILKWGKQGVLLESDGATCFSAPYLTSTYDPAIGVGPAQEAPPWPIMMATEKSDIAFTIDRKVFIDIVKGQAPLDEHNRVTFIVDTGSVRVTPFGSTDGMDVPCKGKGTGIRSVSADYLNGLLSHMDAKEVTLRWDDGVPAISITAEDYENWTILLAPAGL
jgi:hypothetical protein